MAEGRWRAQLEERLVIADLQRAVQGVRAIAVESGCDDPKGR